MAETAVGLVVDKLIPLLSEEANLLRGIHREFEEIKDQLESILAFLRDADSRAEVEANNEINQGVTVWVRELRKVAFKIFNVIDEYTHFIARQQQPHRGRFINFLRKVACFVLELKPCHDIASKIQDLKQKVCDIKRNCATYGFNATQQGSTLTGAQTNTWYDPRKDSPFLKETEVVGIESAKNELIRVLQDESSQRPVISVVGMGGLGKTTLVHQVYVHVKESFNCCYAWIEVSQTYNKIELLRNLMKKLYQANNESIPKGIDDIDESTMISKLRDYLQGKRYVVVFDDVWNHNFWVDVKNALPDDNKKSGIFITTRDIEVAKFCRSTSPCVHIHQLQPLPEEEAWKLFCNKAFHSEPEKNCPTNLNALSHEIVKRCEGLPLAIVLIAGLLSTKDKNIDQWRKLHTSLSSELESNAHLKGIMKILSLSYSDLPYYLKCCFLYFGIFPEDYSIRSKRLIQQWIAEGFVKPKKDKELEIVAEECMVELLNRSLVQVSEVDFDGKARSFRVHDLLHELILKKMEDLSFCQVFSGKDSNFTGLTQRISLANGSHEIINRSSLKVSHVQSIFIFDKDKMPNHFVSAVATNFKFLKVLDFEDAPNLHHLPKDIGKLVHLKSLSLRGTRVKLLPKSIGRLENLETLDLKLSLVHELPVEINRLHKLRYLLAYSIDKESAWHFYTRRGVKIRKGFGKLKALQKLYDIEANIVGVDLFNELSKLTKLRKLGIKKLISEDGRRLCTCIEQMEHLESLEVKSISEDEKIDLESMSSPPKSLKRLSLIGHLTKLPEWIPKLENLVRMSISCSKMEVDPLKALQNLRNLLELNISHNGYYGEKLHFEEGAFPELKELILRSLSRLNSIVIDEGALSKLEMFWIGPCPQLKELPSGFQHLRSLKYISFVEMPTKFLMFLEFQSLQIVPNVGFSHTIDGQLRRFPSEWVMTMLENMREYDEVEWESMEFGEIYSMVFGPDRSARSSP